MEKYNKVAAITIIFWLMKIIATTLGETLGDFLSMTLNLGYTVGIGITLLFFGIVLSIQLYAKKYVPVYFWLVIIATTTLGTEISDFIDRTLHLGYTFGSILLFAGLIAALATWYQKFKSLAVYPIINRNKEVHYWIAILFSNSLGTAFGDFLSDDLGLSYQLGAMITAGIIVVVVLLHYLTSVNEIVLFWIAFIFTRPFGATFGDLLTKPVAKGGLELGTLSASLVSVALMAVLVFISHRQLRTAHSKIE
ncbi:hypothetical protein GC194_08770 [bacterium]|nr:hypothetical protein [bacterium]